VNAVLQTAWSFPRLLDTQVSKLRAQFQSSRADCLVQSVVGSLACLGGGFLTALVYLEFFRWSGSLQMPGGMPVAKLLLISVVGTVIESFPIEDWDNLTVSVTVALTSRLLLAQMYKSGLRNGGG